MSTDYPNDLRYTKEHEWARVDGKVATVGITRFAVDQLGDITQVELPKEGETVTKDQVFGSVESVKAVSDVYSPAAGEVTETNGALADAPERVNEDPYGQGWIMKLKLSDPQQVEKLMSAAEYTAYVGAES